jgi:hypothetical protein
LPRRLLRRRIAVFPGNHERLDLASGSSRRGKPPTGSGKTAKRRKADDRPHNLRRAKDSLETVKGQWRKCGSLFLLRKACRVAARARRTKKSLRVVTKVASRLGFS